MGRNSHLIKGCYKALDAMKYEIAGELGIHVPTEGGGTPDWASVTSYQAGSCGGLITKRLVAYAEQVLAGQQANN
jgi:hypothetical protein